MAAPASTFCVAVASKVIFQSVKPSLFQGHAAVAGCRLASRIADVVPTHAPMLLRHAPRLRLRCVTCEHSEHPEPTSAKRRKASQRAPLDDRFASPFPNSRPYQFNFRTSKLPKAYARCWCLRAQQCARCRLLRTAGRCQCWCRCWCRRQPHALAQHGEVRPVPKVEKVAALRTRMVLDGPRRRQRGARRNGGIAGHARARAPTRTGGGKQNAKSACQPKPLLPRRS